jgi:hypothetical protein
MHPVEAIIQAAAAAVEAELGAYGSVYTHRIESVDTSEMPCICLNYGADSEDDEHSDLQHIGSVVELMLVAKIADPSEQTVREQLLAFRAMGHRAMASTAMGWLVKYGGATAPQIEIADRVVGEQTSRWLVFYQMPNDDPE